MYLFLNKIALIFLIALSANHAFTQENAEILSHKKDSLHKIIFTPGYAISEKGKAIGLLKKHRIPIDHSVQLVIEELLQNKNCTQTDKINLHHYYGMDFYSKGDLQKAEEQLSMAYQYYKSSAAPDVDPLLFVNYGLIKNNLGKNEEAISIYLEGVKINEKITQNKNLGHLYVKLGDVYLSLKKYNEAEKYYAKAIAINIKLNDKKIEAFALRGLGMAALESSKFSEAEAHFKTSSDLFKSVSDHFMANDTKCYLASTYDEMNKFDKAETLYNEAHQYFKNSGYKGDLYYISLDIGNHNLKKGDYAKAIASCSFAKDNFLKMGDISWATDAWKCMYEAAKESGNHKDALTYYEKYILYRDSLTNEKNIQKITELRKDFEFNKEKDKIEGQNTLKIEKEKAFQKYLMICLFLLTGLLFFAVRAYKIKARTNKIIHRQKDQLEQYNKANENLIFSLSHDIKEPMLSLQLLLKKLKIDDAVLENASRSIGNQISSINSIVNNLLLIKKTSVTENEEQTDHKTIIKTIEGITHQLNYKLEDKNIELINTVYDAANFSLPISSQKLYLILLNLMNNAIRYSPENNKIEIFATKDGIYIRDYGKGIDNDNLKKLGKENIDNDDFNGGSGMGLLLAGNMLIGTKMRLKFEHGDNGGTIAGLVII